MYIKTKNTGIKVKAVLKKGVIPKWVPTNMNGIYLKSKPKEKASEIYNSVLF